MVETYRGNWQLAEWTVDDWITLELLLNLDGFTIRHCTHCDRYPAGDPDKHPSCLIVEIGE